MKRNIIGGFTLVELMVVISIVSLISSVTMQQTAQARAKAEDSKKKTEVRQIETALALKKTTSGRVPRNYNCSGTYCAGGTGGAPAREGTQAFNASMQELVSEGYLSAIPDSKDDSYVYYATPTADSAVFGAELQMTAANVVAGQKNYCSTMPTPYTSCVNTMSTGSYVAAQEDADTVVFRESGGYAAQFCRAYGPATSTCWASGGNGLFASACSGVSSNPIPSGTIQVGFTSTAYAAEDTLAQFQVGGPGGLPGFNLCTKAAVSYDISCDLQTAQSVSTCAGGGNDYCACI